MRTVLAPLRRDTPSEPPQRGQHPLVLVACSGGADSLALAAATAFVAPRCGIRGGLITVDHGLLPESAAQAERVAALGAELGLAPVEVVRVQVGRAGGPEAAARAARYTALDAAAAASDAHLLLGHTLDDQAETVLLGLGRGSGPRSIVGMAAVDGRYLRPFLRLRRATTAAACAALGLAPWCDPHNADPAFQRVQLRREVLPLLEDVLQGGVAEALARTADLLRDDLAALDGWAEHARIAARRPPAGLDAGALIDLPRAVRTRVLRAWARDRGAAPLSAERTGALDALVVAWHGQGPVDLPGGVSVARTSGTLVAYSPPSPQE
ncbi:MAG TPA: tRNA lysidine(34) synthetase TilS [Jatrophihabitans sp.]|nr:tRNA lysidine(34) synthetase TilS [Jatrophihabitans sp.]